MQTPPAEWLAAATFSEMLVAHARAGRTALVSSEGKLSYGELLCRAQGLSEWLDVLHVPRGQVVPALLTTQADAVALVLAGYLSGRPVAPLAARATPRELIACVQPLGASVLVHETAFEVSARQVASRCALRSASLISAPASNDPHRLPREPEQRVAILHTSGTTGAPKAVPISEGRLVPRVRVNAGLVGLTPGSVYASASPFHHIAGLGMILVALGAGAAIAPFAAFSTAAWKQLERIGVTHALLVPTMIERLLEAGALRLESLETLQYGAAPIELDTLRGALAALPGVRFVQIFGQTEGSPITCLTQADHLRAARGEERLLGTVGRPADGVELRIDSPDANGIGEVWARAPHLFRPAADGWLHTGDLGSLDAEGYLTLAGRRGDMIIRGGENVYPLEVERALEEHPAVLNSAVIGVADRLLGQKIRAYLVLGPGAVPPDASGMRAFARERLAGYKVPEDWVVVDELPRNPAGKLLRRELGGPLEELRRLEDR